MKEISNGTQWKIGAGDELRILRKIGEGGMGAVYEAMQLNLRRQVAVKFLSPRLAADRVFVKRFQREARVAAALSHPGIVQVYDIGKSPAGAEYIVLEYVEGENLAQRLDRCHRMPLLDALAVVRQVAEALAAALEKDIIHRDVKPENIMLSTDGQVKLADLGLARAMTEDTVVTLTRQGFGSPYFMSPEQAEDASSVDHRADIYSLGVSLFNLLTGEYPFKEHAGSPYKLINAHCKIPLPKSSQFGVELPAAVEDLMQQMCAKTAADRPQSYADLIARIDSIAEERNLNLRTTTLGEGIPVHNSEADTKGWRHRRLALLTAGLTLAGGLTWFSFAPSQPSPPAVETSTNVFSISLEQYRPYPRGEDGHGPPAPVIGIGIPPYGFSYDAYLLPTGPPPNFEIPEIPLNNSPQNLRRWMEEFAAANPGKHRTILTTMMAAIDQYGRGSAFELIQEFTPVMWRQVDLMEKDFDGSFEVLSRRMIAHVRTNNYEAAYNVWLELPKEQHAFRLYHGIEEIVRDYIPAEELAKLRKRYDYQPDYGPGVR